MKGLHGTPRIFDGSRIKNLNIVQKKFECCPEGGARERPWGRLARTCDSIAAVIRVARRLALLLPLLAASCRGREAPPVAASGPAAPRVLLIGLDGADMRTIDRLVAAGRLPTFARLKREGASGRLASVEPMLSPIVWTSIATGRMPQDNGIFDFVEVRPDGTPVPITSDRRRVPALWNLAGEFGKSSGFIGWYASYPAEKVAGFQVSDRLGFHQVRSESAVAGATFPEGLRAELLRDVGGPAVDPAATRARFSDASAAPESVAAADRLAELAKIHATSELYRRLTPALQRRYRPDLLAVYFETIDACGHLFMENAPPGLPGTSADDNARFARTVDRCYEYQDEVLGDLLALEGANTVTIICSDHGFKSGGGRPKTSGRADTGVAVLWHRREGVILVHGASVAAGAEIRGATALDVAPTVLALLSIPLSRELPGRPLSAAFVPGTIPAEPARVDRYSPRPAPPERAAAAADPEALKRLAALGYLGGAGAALAHDSGGRTAASYANEGAARLAGGDPDGALRAFGRALELDPRQPSALVDAATVLSQRGDFLRARELFDRAVAARPGDAAALLQRASMRLRMGELPGAAADLDEVGKIDDRLPLYRLLRAVAADAAGRREEALAELDRAEALSDPDDPIAAIDATRAQIASALGRPAVAEAALARAAASMPESALTETRGDVALARGDAAAAARYYRAAAQARPADAAPERKLAAALSAASDRAGAEAALTRAVEKSSGPAERESAWAALALFVSRSGDAGRADAVLERATRDLPESAGLWSLRGSLLAKQGRLDEAISAEERSVAIRPTPGACRNLGVLLARRGDRARAAALLKQSLALNADQPEVREMLKRLGG